MEEKETLRLSKKLKRKLEKRFGEQVNCVFSIKEAKDELSLMQDKRRALGSESVSDAGGAFAALWFICAVQQNSVVEFFGGSALIFLIGWGVVNRLTKPASVRLNSSHDKFYGQKKTKRDPDTHRIIKEELLEKGSVHTGRITDYQLAKQMLLKQRHGGPKPA